MADHAVSRQPVEVFISYSRKDLRFLEQLYSHLKIYERDGLIRVWYYGNLTPGAAWEQEIYSRFCSARVILLLVSADFFASDYCSQRELPEALGRQKQGSATVVPVIIRPVDWKRTALAKLMVLPKNSQAIDLWENVDQAFESVATSLREHLDQILGFDASSNPTLGPWGGATADGAGTSGAVSLSRNPDLAVSQQVTLPQTVPLPFPTPAPPLAAVRPRNRSPRRVPPPATATRVRPDSSTADSAAVGPVLVPAGVQMASSQMGLKAELPEIVVCFLHRERRDKLRRLRRWCLDPQDRLFDGPAARVAESANLAAAVERVRQQPDSTILLLDGFEPSCPQLDEFAVPGQQSWPFNLIVNSPEWEQFAPLGASASILQPVQAITYDDTLLMALRKALLRVRTRQTIRASVLDTPDELAAFFEIRHRVWTELGYLSPQKTCPQTPWELDYTDRTSIPLGLFSKADGRLLGAARLVRAFGKDNHAQIRKIDEMLRQRNAQKLIENFRYPQSQSHPFDILGELGRFKEYFRTLVRRGVATAEVSRVVVTPEYRKSGLGEVLVDTLCSLARINAIRVLFLACHTKHAGFYERCGFREIPGVTGNQFLTYKVPCMAMERELIDTTEWTEEDATPKEGVLRHAW